MTGFAAIPTAGVLGGLHGRAATLRAYRGTVRTFRPR
jgi:hypothetical protein